jgi:uncharacterized protein (TIGR02231 family)
VSDIEGSEAPPASGDGGPATIELSAPIAAVTVFPDRARVTRRGAVELAAGERRVVVAGLPLALQADSVRVAGTGPATVLGVDIARRHRPRTADEVALDLEDQLRAARTALAALEDEDAVAGERLAFLSELARRSTRSYAKALAAGGTDPAQVAELSDALATQQAAVRQERRALAEERERASERIGALQRTLETRQRQREPDSNSAIITLTVQAESSIELELSYLVNGAGWHSAYDLRLDGDELSLTWYGLATQHTGEDWPECDLRLSTARPSGALAVPELDPWFLDRARPVPPPVPRGGMPYGAVQAAGVARGRAAAAPAYAAEDMAVPLVESVATIEQGATAATYKPARAVAVPADGGAHRSTVAVLEFTPERDYVTAPVLAEEAHLRVKVTNTSEHTLPGGSAAVFHAGDFVGSAAVDVWAPGEELELALGVDDRVRVERKLVRRSATKAVLGSTRRREAEHRITVTNHTPAPARITVLDQLPVSRDDAIVVKELRLEPPPAERTDMGVLTWVLQLAPGESSEIHLGVRVEESRGVQVAGWRE